MEGACTERALLRASLIRAMLGGRCSRCIKAAVLVGWLFLASCVDGLLVNPIAGIVCWQPSTSRFWTKRAGGGKERVRALSGLCSLAREVGASKALTERDGSGDILAAITPLLQKQERKNRNTRKQKPTPDVLSGKRGVQSPQTATAERGSKSHAVRGPGIGVETALEYEREGHTMLRGLVSGTALERLSKAVNSEFDHRATEAYSQKLRELGVSSDAIPRKDVKAALAKACGERGLPVPSLQVYNLHRADRPASKAVYEFVTSADLGQVAADLMGVDSVMLYQTAAFYKFVGEGETAWHSDLNTAPFDTNYMVTFWIALTDVPTLQHSPLIFASRSHKDFALAYWHTLKGMKDLDARGYKTNKFAPLAKGDATAHNGWLIHTAPPNTSKRDRKALGVAFVAAHARRLGVKDTRVTPNDVDRKGYKEVQNPALIGNTHETWIEEITPGKPVKHRLLPVVYARPGA